MFRLAVKGNPAAATLFPLAQLPVPANPQK
jgi:hypothetical protein